MQAVMNRTKQAVTNDRNTTLVKRYLLLGMKVPMVDNMMPTEPGLVNPQME